MKKPKTDFIENGAFILSRNIFDNPIWDEPEKFRLFMYFIGKAQHAQYRVGKICVPRGSYIRSLRQIKNDTCYIKNNSYQEYSISRIKQLTDEMIKEELLSKINTEYGTMWNVVNYEKYQNLSNYERLKNNETPIGIGISSDTPTGL